MKKVKTVMIMLLTIIVTGCSNVNPERQEERGLQGEEQYIDSENDGISFDRYGGYWSYEGKTQDQILAGGGIIF